MKRRLFTILSALSLLLAVCVGVPCAQSYWAREWRSLNVFHTSYPVRDLARMRIVGITWAGAQLGLGMSCTDFNQSPADRYSPAAGFQWQYSGLAADPSDPIVRRTTLGFGAEHTKTTTPAGGGVTDAWHVAMPVWLVLVMLFYLPCRWLVMAYTRRRRWLHGCCLHCGYDLRATTERCPECGTPIPA